MFKAVAVKATLALVSSKISWRHEDFFQPNSGTKPKMDVGIFKRLDSNFL